MNIVKNNFNQIVIIYPYKFGTFLWEKYHFDELSKICSVEVWDISQFVHKKFAKNIFSVSHQNNQIIKFKGLIQFLLHLRQFLKNNKNNKVYIIDKTSFNNSFEVIIRVVVIFYFLIKRCEVIRELIPGIAVNNYENRERLGTFNKIKSQFVFSEGLNYLLYNSKSFVLKKFEKLLPAALNYQLVAGELFEERVKKSISKKVKLIKYHSLDYNDYLASLKNNKVVEVYSEKSAILLDGPDPYFNGDEILTGQKVRLTVGKWYPALNNFLLELEIKFDLQIKIMGHYKTNYVSPSPIFDNRKVEYGKTLEETKAAQFVITRDSSAISYAVLLRKPVLFIFSDEMKANPKMLKQIRFLAECLGTTPININQIPKNLSKFLNIQEEFYANYEKMYLTSANRHQLNNEIIFKEILYRK